MLKYFFAAYVVMSMIVSVCFADEITPEALKNAKSCVALVRVGQDSEGSAFYIGDGLFITNAHVVSDAQKDEKIVLVLNSGEPNQRILPTTVVKRDDGADIAVLRCEDTKLTGRLDLGSSSNLNETSQLLALGFPLGSDLAVGKNDFPNISINTGRITALRKDGEKTVLIQFDAAVSSGSSGGPILNNSGQVIGIVQSGIRGENLHFAIPVNDLRKLIYGSLMHVRIPALKSEPGVASNVLIESILEGNQDPSLTVTLKLHAPGDEAKEYKAKYDSNGVYQVSAPLTSANQSKLIKMDVLMPEGLYHYTIRDKSVTTGARTLSLSEIKEITLGTFPSIQLVNGETIKNAISGVGRIEVFRKGALVPTDIHKAKSLSIFKIKTSAVNVAYEVIAKRGEEVVTTQKGFITEMGPLPDVDLKGEVKEKTQVGIELPEGIACARNPKNGHFYCVIRNIEGLTWELAALVSEKFTYKGLHGHLATLTSPDENQFVFAHFPAADGGFFIGGYQDTKAPDYREPAGGWRWVTGEKFQWTNWRAGEPNDTAGTSNYISLFGDATWNDCLTTDGKAFMIEFE